MHQPGKLPPIKLMDGDALSELSRWSLEQHTAVTSVSIIAHNGSVFAEAHRKGSQIHSSGSSPSSTSPPPATVPALDSAITTTRSLRTQAITYATAYLSYLRDLRPDAGSVSASPSSSNMSSSGYLEGDPITYESRKSPSVAIISPVGEKILLAVTGDFSKPKTGPTDGDSLGPSNEPTQTASGAAADYADENDLTTATASTPAPGPGTTPDLSSDSNPDAESSSPGRLTPPHDLIETLKEVSETLAERLRAEFQGMKWPSDL